MIFANSLSSKTKIHIEGFKGQKKDKDHVIKIESQWADISPNLKTQRLYGVQIEAETPFEILKMKSEQALFKEEEVIFLKSASIDSFLKNKANSKGCFKIISENDAIIFNFLTNTVSGADATIEFGNRQQKGRGFKIDLNLRKLTWLSGYIDLKTKEPIKTPLEFKLDCK